MPPTAYPRGTAQKGLLLFYAACAAVGHSDALVTAETGGGWPKWLASTAPACTLAAHVLEFFVVFIATRAVLKRLPETESIWPHFLPTVLYGLGHWMRLTKPKKA